MKSIAERLQKLPANVDEYVLFMRFLQEGFSMPSIQRRCVEQMELLDIIKDGGGTGA